MKAVLVGINNYQHSPDDQLRGCVTDMNNLWKYLTRSLHFDPSRIVLRKDSLATAKLEKVDVMAMILNSTSGDHLIHSHSSHGSNNPDPSQQDGLQELLCSYDIKEDGAGDWDEDTCITARWIGQTIAKLHPEATLDIIIDACHAPVGSQLKSFSRTYNKARWLPRPVAGVPVKPKTVQAIQSTIPKNVALWSACEPQQTSADAYIDGSWQGAFTAAFLVAVQKAKLRTDIIYLARKWLQENHYQQTPHLYCWPEMAQRSFAG